MPPVSSFPPLGLTVPLRWARVRVISVAGSSARVGWLARGGVVNSGQEGSGVPAPAECQVAEPAGSEVGEYWNSQPIGRRPATGSTVPPSGLTVPESWTVV